MVNGLPTKILRNRLSIPVRERDFSLLGDVDTSTEAMQSLYSGNRGVVSRSDGKSAGKPKYPLNLIY
jgi:hypothetical protein